jgi:hypothetical protein
VHQKAFSCPHRSPVAGEGWCFVHWATTYSVILSAHGTMGFLNLLLCLGVEIQATRLPMHFLLWNLEKRKRRKKKRTKKEEEE